MITLAPQARASSMALSWVLGFAFPSNISTCQPSPLASSAAVSDGIWQPFKEAEQDTMASLTFFGALAGCVGPWNVWSAATAGATHVPIETAAMAPTIANLMRLRL